ncbi:hypothetical protein PTRA_a0989 [Pseudoalteromonas translucida KMM 520]|uniref:Orphan protein signal peptide n=1 Tax=Pseudoalteromonas translucida KMM 520 TaxID=1315283 RepID=A0A0U2VC94_9GAMM|nr:hypothetical protein [Pseudoalteromonas translucida]ALS32272.1 hypothetical protein PTRA_a0989 [Pseudoalteromonas translucida KMM 520]
MRFLVVSLFILFSSGCAITTIKNQPAEPLAMPLKPMLKSQTYQLEYEAQHTSPKVKSVQLPAHKVMKNQTVKIVTDRVSVTDTLLAQISQALNDKQLKVTTKNDSDYTLAIHQVDLAFTDDSKYTLNQPKQPYALYSKVAQQFPTQQCATILAQVSMRLTHKASGDVVWFAKSSLDSTSFHRESLIYSFTEEQKITNELEVVAFVHQQNTEQARLARADANTKVTIPKYNTMSQLSTLTKVQGPCTRTEISALTPMMQFYLSSILIDKIKVI